MSLPFTYNKMLPLWVKNTNAISGGTYNGSVSFKNDGKSEFVQDAVFDGKVAIGKAPSAYELDVAGNINVSGNVFVNGLPIDTGGGVETDGSYVWTGQQTFSNAGTYITGNLYVGPEEAVTITSNVAGWTHVGISADDIQFPYGNTYFGRKVFIEPTGELSSATPIVYTGSALINPAGNVLTTSDYIDLRCAKLNNINQFDQVNNFNAGILVQDIYEGGENAILGTTQYPLEDIRTQAHAIEINMSPMDSFGGRQYGTLNIGPSLVSADIDAGNIIVSGNITVNTGNLSVAKLPIFTGSQTPISTNFITKAYADATYTGGGASNASTVSLALDSNTNAFCPLIFTRTTNPTGNPLYFNNEITNGLGYNPDGCILYSQFFSGGSMSLWFSVAESTSEYEFYIPFQYENGQPICLNGDLCFIPVSNTLRCNNFQGNLVGTADTATNAVSVSLATDNTSGTYYIPFSKTTSATGNNLYIDNTTTPLSYNPSTSTLSCANFQGTATLAGTNAFTGINSFSLAPTYSGSATVFDAAAYVPRTYIDTNYARLTYNAVNLYNSINTFMNNFGIQGETTLCNLGTTLSPLLNFEINCPTIRLNKEPVGSGINQVFGNVQMGTTFYATLDNQQIDICGNLTVSNTLSVVNYPTFIGTAGTPSATNLITRAYGDSVYGRLDTENTWAQNQTFNGENTTVNGIFEVNANDGPMILVDTNSPHVITLSTNQLLIPFGDTYFGRQVYIQDTGLLSSATPVIYSGTALSNPNGNVLITRAYGDTVYGRLDGSQNWTGQQTFSADFTYITGQVRIGPDNAFDISVLGGGQTQIGISADIVQIPNGPAYFGRALHIQTTGDLILDERKTLDRCFNLVSSATAYYWAFGGEDTITVTGTGTQDIYFPTPTANSVGATVRVVRIGTNQVVMRVVGNANFYLESGSIATSNTLFSTNKWAEWQVVYIATDNTYAWHNRATQAGNANLICTLTNNQTFVSGKKIFNTEIEVSATRNLGILGNLLIGSSAAGYNPYTTHPTFITTSIALPSTSSIYAKTFFIGDLAGNIAITLPALSSTAMFAGIEFVFRRAGTTTTSTVSFTATGTDVIHGLNLVSTATTQVGMVAGATQCSLICVQKGTSPFKWALMP